MRTMSSIDYSIKGIVKVTLPLVLADLSTHLMYVSDRLILTFYSTNAMNAASISGNFVSMLTFMFVSIAGVASVFVGQYNGSKQFNKIAQPVWQMIYLSLFSSVFFIILALSSKHINLLPNYCLKEGVEYQSTLLFFGFLPGLGAAISSFFIGRGKTAIVTGVVVLSNIINILLDIILIFGVKNIIPAMGGKGAAIATVISAAVEVLILAAIFLNRKNRKNYNTVKHSSFNKKLVIECCRIGAPLSIGRMIELAAWYLVYVALSHVSPEMATIQGIAVSIYLLFIFFGDGLSKAISALSSNLIGMENFEGIRRLLRIFSMMAIITGGMLMIPLVFCQNMIFSVLGAASDNLSSIYPVLSIIFKILVINITLEAIGSVIWGILLAGGDTRYPIIANLSCLWGFVVIPVGVMFFLEKLNSVIIVYILTTIWCFSSLVFLYTRYKSRKWYNKLI